MQNSYQFAFTKVFSLKSVLLHRSHIFRQSGYCRSQDLTSNSGGVFNAHCMCEFAFVFSPLPTSTCFRHILQQTFRKLGWSSSHTNHKVGLSRCVFRLSLARVPISIHIPNRELPSPTESHLNVVVICAEQALFS